MSHTHTSNDTTKLREDIERVRSTINDLISFDREMTPYLGVGISDAVDDQKKLLRSLEEQLWLSEPQDYLNNLGENKLDHITIILIENVLHDESSI
jgi:plasmid maintenance system antidote protein VapI